MVKIRSTHTVGREKVVRRIDIYCEQEQGVVSSFLKVRRGGGKNEPTKNGGGEGLILHGMVFCLVEKRNNHVEF